jgi:hypothetical protein
VFQRRTSGEPSKVGKKDEMILYLMILKRAPHWSPT